MKESYEYYKPESLNQVFELLYQYGEGARLVSGGTDVFVQQRQTSERPEAMISLRHIAELAGIRVDGDRLVIGAATTLRDIEHSELLASEGEILVDATRRMASVQIRNVATIGGNIVTAAPSADTAGPLLALGATAELKSSAGARQVPLREYFTGPGRTVMAPGEVLCRFLIPRPKGPAGGCYLKMSRRQAMDLALVSVGVQLELDESGDSIVKARIGLGVAGPTPMRSLAAEAKLDGRPATQATLKDAARVSCDDTACRDSVRGQAWYREEMIEVLTLRAGRVALDRAKAKV
ncbi:MAG: xanthine dehydrogenase family protein subunit M [Proteobacteria bacterium]|nr:xanthine dehydrogenase family protein subunit M [Pseudomonadota bacterium]